MPKTTDDDLVDLPGFAPSPTSTPTADPLDPETTSTTELPPVNEWDDEQLGGNEGPTSSKASTGTAGPSRASTADWRDFRELIHTIVALGSVVVRFARTRRRNLPDHIWLADEQDQAAIGDPLARIAARHSPLEGGDGDTIDGLMVIAGGAGYVVKNVLEEAHAGPQPVDLTVDDGTAS